MCYVYVNMTKHSSNLTYAINVDVKTRKRRGLGNSHRNQAQICNKAP